MFTGIIQELGTIGKINQNGPLLTLTIKAHNILTQKKKGDSIAVDGACLSIINLDAKKFSVEAMAETQNRTIIKSYQIGTPVNLESSLKLSDPLDGHIVSGHIDFTTTLIKRTNNLCTFSLPTEYRKYFAIKGSVAVNGVSLTISNLQDDSFEVALIPITLEHTNLGNLQVNNAVNIEIDLISRYLESLLGAKEQQISHDFLKERGFI